MKRHPLTAMDLRSRAVYAQSGLITRLQDERKRHQVTYAVLAAKAGLSESSACDILTGKTKEPSWIALTAIANVLGIRLECYDQQGNAVSPAATQQQET